RERDRQRESVVASLLKPNEKSSLIRHAFHGAHGWLSTKSFNLTRKSSVIFFARVRSRLLNSLRSIWFARWIVLRSFRSLSKRCSKFASYMPIAFLSLISDVNLGSDTGSSRVRWRQRSPVTLP